MAKTVLLCANTAWCLYQFRRGVIKAFLDQGIKVIALTAPDEVTPLLKRMGCEVIDLNISVRGVNPLADLAMLWQMVRLYKKCQPDLIFHYTVKPNIYGSIAARLAGIPSLSIATGLGFSFINESWVTKVVRQLYKVAFRYPEQVWFLNPDDRKEFLDFRLVDESRTRLLPGEGVDTSHFLPQPNSGKEGEFRFLLIARLLWDKGVGEYVAAAREIRKSYPNARFQMLGVIGASNPSKIGEAQVDAWVREGVVEYLGATSDVRPFIASAQCVVLPSYREGVSRILMEAASMERPLVATNVPGCREVIIAGTTGFLCEPRNVADLTKKLKKMLLLSDEQRKAMAKAGREFVINNLDEKIVIRHYIEVLRKFGIV
ncbi:MAG: glycosyltransferase family 4 protein [Pseudomonadota bacterium]